MSIIEKAKLLFKVREPVQELIATTKDFKHGYKTVTFWVTVVGSLIALASSVTGMIPGIAGIVLVTALTAIYSILRGLQKADQVGVKPILKTTEFWLTVVNSVSSAFIGLQNSGVNPEWMVAAQIVLTGAAGIAQNLSGHQPVEGENK